MTTQTHFHQRLEELRIKTVEMAAYTQRALERAIFALFERDTEIAQEVIDGDQVVNELECAVDELSLALLALETPVAVDLRTVIGLMRASTQLERIADEAVNVAERSMFLSSRPPLPLYEELEELANVSMTMLRGSITALREQDTSLANEICAMDNKADILDLKVLKRLIDHMLSERRAIERAVYAVLIARSLERIGDLATNIAEITVFIVKGVDIKHKCQSE